MEKKLREHYVKKKRVQSVQTMNTMSVSCVHGGIEKYGLGHKASERKPAPFKL